MLEENVWHRIRMVLVEGIMEKTSLKKLGKIIEINRILQNSFIGIDGLIFLHIVAQALIKSYK